MSKYWRPRETLSGAFALLERSLRTDARAWSAHTARFVLAGAIYASLCFALSTQRMFGAPGLRFFQSIAFLDATMMTLFGLGFFSTTITEEKEEDTLGLMLMAGINPLGILAGKTGGRLWQAVLLIAVQYPFTLLALTMGGITSEQILAIHIALLAYMILLAGFGLLCSTVASNSRAASRLMIFGLGLYLIVPSLAKSACWYNAIATTGGKFNTSQSDLSWKLLSWIGDLGIFGRLIDILATGFSESPWSLQVITNFATGVICAGLSWALFGLATRTPGTETASRGLVSRQRAFFRFNAGRPKINPFIWKDFHFVSGGIWMMIIRVIYYGGMAIAMYIEDSVTGSLGQNAYVDIGLLWMSFSVAVDAAIVLARSMHDEIRGQTLSSLLMLPRSSIAIIYCKFAGAMICWLPGPLIELALTLGTRAGRLDAWELCRFPGAPVIVLLFVIIPHFAALVSLYVRWGAVPVAIGLTIGIYVAIFAAIRIASIWGHSEPVAFSAMAFLMFFICVGCHLGVLLRVQSLAAR